MKEFIDGKNRRYLEKRGGPRSARSEAGSAAHTGKSGEESAKEEKKVFA